MRTFLISIILLLLGLNSNADEIGVTDISTKDTHKYEKVYVQNQKRFQISASEAANKHCKALFQTLLNIFEKESETADPNYEMIRYKLKSPKARTDCESGFMTGFESTDKIIEDFMANELKKNPKVYLVARL